MSLYLKNKEFLFSLLIVIFFIVGLLLHMIPLTHQYVLAITDLTMLLTNSIVFYFLFRNQQSKVLLYWSLTAFLLTFLIELAGVKTGLIFGEYHYGRTMLVQLFDVPLVIGMNWVILMLGSYSIIQWMGLKRYYVPILSSLLIVGFDFVMEEVAMRLDYWQWEGGVVPLQNYIAWFFISLIFTSILALLKVNVESRIIKVYFLVQLGFFVVLRVMG